MRKYYKYIIFNIIVKGRKRLTGMLWCEKVQSRVFEIV